MSGNICAIKICNQQCSPNQWDIPGLSELISEQWPKDPLKTKLCIFLPAGHCSRRRQWVFHGVTAVRAGTPHSSWIQPAAMQAATAVVRTPLSCQQPNLHHCRLAPTSVLSSLAFITCKKILIIYFPQNDAVNGFRPQTTLAVAWCNLGDEFSTAGNSIAWTEIQKLPSGPRPPSTETDSTCWVYSSVGYMKQPKLIGRIMCLLSSHIWWTAFFCTGQWVWTSSNFCLPF